MAQVITANLLTTGHVVFLGADGAWVDSVDEAASFVDAKAAESGMAQAQWDLERAVIVDPFLVRQGPDKNGRPGMSLRDTIRAYGPTIRFQPGKPGPAA